VSTSAVIAEMIADLEEFLDSTDGLDDLLSGLRTLGEGAAPTPSHELMALLAGTPETAPVVALRSRPASHRASRRNAIAGLAAATVAGLSITGAAAAANELPAPIQRVVAHFSESYLPFSFPRPVGDPPAPGTASSSDSGEGADVSTGTDGSRAATTGPHEPQRSGTELRHESGASDAGISPGNPDGGAAGGTTSTDTGAETDTGSGTGQGDGQDHGQPGGTDHGQDHGQDSGQDGDQGSGQGSGQGDGSTTGPGTGQGHAYAGQGDAGKGVPPTAPPGQGKKPTSPGGDTAGSTSNGGGQSAAADDSGADPAAEAGTGVIGSVQGQARGQAKGVGGGRSTP